MLCKWKSNISFPLNHLGQGEKGCVKGRRGTGGWGKELMIRATWRKGWVSRDEEGLTFKRIHDIRYLSEV